MNQTTGHQFTKSEKMTGCVNHYKMSTSHRYLLYLLQQVQNYYSEPFHFICRCMLCYGDHLSGVISVFWTVCLLCKCGGQYKRELILPCQRASFSGDAVECLSWSCKLCCSERGQYLDGWPLHVTKWWQRSDSGVWWRPVSGRASVELWAFVAMMGWGFIPIWTWFRPGTTVVVVMNGGCHCWAGAKHPERTHVKLRGEASLRRGKCGGQ
jgi:hypothetical protein